MKNEESYSDIDKSFPCIIIWTIHFIILGIVVLLKGDHYSDYIFGIVLCLFSLIPGGIFGYLSYLLAIQINEATFDKKSGIKLYFTAFIAYLRVLIIWIILIFIFSSGDNSSSDYEEDYYWDIKAHPNN